MERKQCLERQEKKLERFMGEVFATAKAVGTLSKGKDTRVLRPSAQCFSPWEVLGTQPRSLSHGERVME